MIELTTSLMMLASAFLPAVDMKKEGQTDATSTQATSTVAQAIPGDQFLPVVSVEAYVREYFKETPILAEIARCESTFRQFDSKGNVLLGKVNSGDIGVMQINKYYHGENAEKLGYDIYTIDGNLSFAKWLYGKYGDSPWVHSSKCWGKYKEIAKI